MLGDEEDVDDDENSENKKKRSALGTVINEYETERSVCVGRTSSLSTCALERTLCSLIYVCMSRCPG